MKKILVLNGPNLNLLGTREPDKYGDITLATINNQLELIAKINNLTLETFQSNAEGDLIDKIHSAIGEFDFIIINPAGFTHTSIAIRDAFLAARIPFIEVHLSNIHARETFRHNSFFSDIAVGVISGFKDKGYYFALEYAITYLTQQGAK